MEMVNILQSGTGGYEYTKKAPTKAQIIGSRVGIRSVLQSLGAKNSEIGWSNGKVTINGKPLSISNMVLYNGSSYAYRSSIVNAYNEYKKNNEPKTTIKATHLIKNEGIKVYDSPYGEYGPKSIAKGTNVEVISASGKYSLIEYLANGKVAKGYILTAALRRIGEPKGFSELFQEYVKLRKNISEAKNPREHEYYHQQAVETLKAAGLDSGINSVSYDVIKNWLYKSKAGVIAAYAEELKKLEELKANVPNKYLGTYGAYKPGDKVIVFASNGEGFLAELREFVHPVTKELWLTAYFLDPDDYENFGNANKVYVSPKTWASIIAGFTPADVYVDTISLIEGKDVITGDDINRWLLAAMILTPEVIDMGIKLGGKNADEIIGLVKSEGLIKGTSNFKTFSNTVEAENWATDVFSSWKNNLSTDEISAINKYTGDDHYDNINSVLRGLSDDFDAGNAKIVDDLTTALSKSSLPESTTLYRGTSTAMLGDLKNLPLDDMVGGTIKEGAYMSSSLSKDVAKQFENGLILKIEAPAGSKGAFIGNISEYSIEAEVLFDKGQTMIIKEAVEVNGILELTVEILN